MPIKRSPIVVVMGHVDHGKSTLLDFIRETHVVDSEKGGITQHLGAYEVEKVVGGEKKYITFLDTPGHAAFSAIRERGAIIADLAILVVSAEEGVKTQTLEALNAILTAGKPYIVAINKIDRPNANVERTKQSLAENNVLVESYGGKIPSVEISAKTGQGVEDLLDLIVLVSDLENLTGEDKGNAEGYILETKRDPKVGVVATLIIKNGKLNTGDFLVTQNISTKIKKLENYRGETVKAASLSAPVRVYGFTDVPPAGETFMSFSDKKQAEKAAESYSPITTSAAETVAKSFYLPVVLKADVTGSLDALRKEVQKIEIADAAFRVIAEGLGAISENDVKLALGSKDSLIVGFNVKLERPAADLAERQGVTIETNDIIYKLTEWLTEKLEERRPKATVEVAIGEAKILKFFSQTKDKQVVGGQVTTGEIKRGREIKIIRRGTEIGRGRINDLEQNKQKVGTVEEGKQFGSVVESKWTIAPGDVIQTFDLVSQ